MSYTENDLLLDNLRWAKLMVYEVFPKTKPKNSRVSYNYSAGQTSIAKTMDGTKDKDEDFMELYEEKSKQNRKMARDEYDKNF